MEMEAQFTSKCVAITLSEQYLQGHNKLPHVDTVEMPLCSENIKEQRLIQ